jgi:hypothetical protein
MKRGSMRKLGRRSFLKGALATAPLLLAGPSVLKPARALAARGLAPSTTAEPYLLPTIQGVRTVPILTSATRSAAIGWSASRTAWAPSTATATTSR